MGDPFTSWYFEPSTGEPPCLETAKCLPLGLGVRIWGLRFRAPMKINVHSVGIPR